MRTSLNYTFPVYSDRLSTIVIILSAAVVTADAVIFRYIFYGPFARLEN